MQENPTEKELSLSEQVLGEFPFIIRANYLMLEKKNPNWVSRLTLANIR